MKKAFRFLIIIVIFFLLFYILEVGGINLKQNNKKITTQKTETTSKISAEVESTTLSTTEATTKKVNTNNNDDTINVSSTVELKYVDGILIVNKTYPLPEDYVPTNTYKDAAGLKYCSECIDNEAYDNFKLMKADALSIGLNIWIQSGYRSYELQNELYTNYVNRDGKIAADTYSARPGHSEHQTGLAFDLNTISDDFQYTDEGKWVNENAWKYGYILRYPKGKDDITGYKYEPWHLRYVGKDLAKKLYNDGDWITLEEHFNLTSIYSE